MIILSIETATQACSAALTDDKQLLAEQRVNLKNIHAATLFPIIHSLFNVTGVQQADLEGIAVSIGPGSFTGLRIGLSAAKGLALGHNLPLVAVPTLESLASQAPISDGTICSILRSRVDEFYTATFSRTAFFDTLVDDVSIKSSIEIANDVPDNAFLIGHTEKLQELESLKERCTFSPQEFCILSAYSAARIGSELFQSGAIKDVNSIEPMYHQQFIAGKPNKIPA